MPEENVNQNEETENTPASDSASSNFDETPTPAVRRRFLTRRNFFVSSALLAGIVLLLVLAAFLVFRLGYFEN
jgi:hypothetical protein